MKGKKCLDNLATTAMLKVLAYRPYTKNLHEWQLFVPF